MEKTFKILKGNHSSQRRFPYFLFSNKINFTIKFESNPEYKLNSIQKQKDTNKLFGISDSFFHRKNSIRIGWRYINDKIEILSYVYVNGKHTSKNICFIEKEKFKKSFNCSIEITKNTYIITFNNLRLTENRKSKWFGPRYLLFPYFGGISKAPKDFLFKIKWGYNG